MIYFTFEELSKTSQKADNAIPNATVKANLEYLVDNLLDPIRKLWGKPIIVNSGYRSPEVNKLVGGAVNSQHLKGEAADITTGTAEGNRKLFEIIANSGLEFDQLIDEKNYRWLHISLKREGNRKQIKHLK